MVLTVSSWHVRDSLNAEIPDVLREIGVSCPKCGKDIVIKKTKKGRRYYGCMGNPECDFMTWQRPSDKKCPECGSVLLHKGNKLVCMNETCGFVMANPKEEDQ